MPETPEFNPLKDRAEEIDQREKQKAEATAKKCRYSIPYEEIARRLGRSEDAVKNYFRGGSKTPTVPDALVLKWCEITGDKPWEIAPHLYPECCSSIIDEYLQWYNSQGV